MKTIHLHNVQKNCSTARIRVFLLFSLVSAKVRLLMRPCLPDFLIYLLSCHGYVCVTCSVHHWKKKPSLFWRSEMGFRYIFISIYLQSLQQHRVGVSKWSFIIYHVCPSCGVTAQGFRYRSSSNCHQHQEPSKQKPGEHVSHSDEPTKSALLVCSLRKARLIRRDSRNHSVCLAFMTEWNWIRKLFCLYSQNGAFWTFISEIYLKLLVKFGGKGLSYICLNYK